MGSTLENKIVAKKDMYLLPSYPLATSAQEFDDKALFFPKGTIFEYFQHKQTDRDDYNNGLHGWCYLIKDTWHHCNFHKYILDEWRQHPDLFEEHSIW